MMKSAHPVIARVQPSHVILNLIQDLPPFPEKPNVDYQEIAGLRYATPAMTV